MTSRRWTFSTAEAKDPPPQKKHSWWPSSSSSEEGESTRIKDSGQSTASDNDDQSLSSSIRSLYDYYFRQLVPATIASVPFLTHRLINETQSTLHVAYRHFLDFVTPKNLYGNDDSESSSSSSFYQLLNATMMSHFDTNGDGHIEPSEWKEMMHHNFAEVLHQLSSQSSSSLQAATNWTDLMLQHLKQSSLTTARRHMDFTWWDWFAREWPLMDWKVGVFLWQTFGGILLVLAVLSIIPGRLHGWSARILRWPVLGLTYFLIGVELIVYVVIRLVIRVAESIVMRPKHRNLRANMAVAESYDEWYRYAYQLDKSQKRHKWMNKIHDDTSYRYNWAFIQELIQDLRDARESGDSLLALAVIQQCTRKNVGGVMSEDLFSYSNTGEPKAIVREFIQEVVTTLHWITDEAIRGNGDGDDSSAGRQKYQEQFQENVRDEKDKLWKSLVDVTASFLSRKDDESKSNHSSEIRRADSVNSSNITFESDDGDHPMNGENKEGEESFENDIISKTNSDETDHESPPVPPSRTRRPHLTQRPSMTPRLQGQPSQQLPSFHREQVLTFLKRARAAYGRTALCLSGGAMMGLYHFGVVKALLEANLLPHIISGTSAGSVVGAIVCTRTDDELMQDLEPEVLVKHLTCFSRPWKDRLKSVMQNGCMFDFDDWMALIKWFCKSEEEDMTFLEAYRRTGKIFCITLSSTSKKSPPVLLNYLSAPNVTIASAVIASAAVPGFVPPVRLQIKDEDGFVHDKGETYWDGSIRQDIPTKGLAEMLNCQFFIASQCNPHIVPFFFNPKGGVGMPSRWSSGTQEDSWRGGFLLAALQMYLKSDMIAKCNFLNDVEAALGFTSTMFTQEFVGSTTIVPQVKFTDYFKLFSDPKLHELNEYFRAGQVASYGHRVMISLHYDIADAIDECVAKLEGGKRASVVKRLSRVKPRNRAPGGTDQPSTENLDAMVADLLRAKKINRDASELADTDDDDEDYEAL